MSHVIVSAQYVPASGHLQPLMHWGGKEREPAWPSCMKPARAMPAAVEAHHPEL